MKNITLPLVSALLGLCLGIGLTAGFFSVSSRATIETPIPAPPASQQDVSITVNAAFLNSQIQQAARQTNMLKQATIALDAPNLVKVAAMVDVTILGQRINTNATVTMRVTVKNNRIALAVDKVDTGNTLVPQSMINNAIENLRAQAENQINTLVQRGLQNTGLRLANARITPSEMTIDLVAQ